MMWFVDQMKLRERKSSLSNESKNIFVRERRQKKNFHKKGVNEREEKSKERRNERRSERRRAKRKRKAFGSDKKKEKKRERKENRTKRKRRERKVAHTNSNTNEQKASLESQARATLGTLYFSASTH